MLARRGWRPASLACAVALIVPLWAPPVVASTQPESLPAACVDAPPSDEPSAEPSPDASTDPTPDPTPDASLSATPAPGDEPTVEPEPDTTDEPSQEPSPEPTAESSGEPTSEGPISEPDLSELPDLATRSGQLPTIGCPRPVASVVAQPGHTQVMLSWSLEGGPAEGRSLVVDEEIAEDPVEDGATSPDVTDEPAPAPSDEPSTEPNEDPVESEGDEVAAEEEEQDDANEAPNEAVQPVVTLDRPVTSFLIQVTPGDRLVSVDGETRSAVISGLRNGTEYTFTVFPANELGRGDGVQAKATPLNGMEGEVAGLLVKFAHAVSADQESVPGGERVTAVDLSIDRAVSDDVHLVTLSDAVDVNTAQQIATELAADPDVEWAEPDQFVFIAQNDADSQALPNDELFADQQWNLWDEFGVGLANGNTSVNPAWS